jgi:hypothetical protein
MANLAILATQMEKVGKKQQVFVVSISEVKEPDNAFIPVHQFRANIAFYS